MLTSNQVELLAGLIVVGGVALLQLFPDAPLSWLAYVVVIGGAGLLLFQRCVARKLRRPSSRRF